MLRRRDDPSILKRLAAGAAAVWALGGLVRLGVAAGAVAGGYVVAKKLVRATDGRTSTGRRVDPAFI